MYSVLRTQIRAVKRGCPSLPNDARCYNFFISDNSGLLMLRILEKGMQFECELCYQLIDDVYTSFSLEMPRRLNIRAL